MFEKPAPCGPTSSAARAKSAREGAAGVGEEGKQEVFRLIEVHRCAHALDVGNVDAGGRRNEVRTDQNKRHIECGAGGEADEDG